MSLTRSKAILELGKKLVTQLERDNDNDLLTSWMAHYIAQRIEEAEQAPTEAKSAAQDACAKAILELWQHRNSLPKHLRPYEQLEAIQRTLASLDVDQTDYRYYPSLLQEVADVEADEEIRQLLNLAIGLDYSARLLIQSTLRAVAKLVETEVEPWVQLAHHIDDSKGVESEIMALVLENGEKREDYQDALLDQASRLEIFAKIAMLKVEEIRDELGHNEPEES